jgi:hypothetical protein
MTAANPRFQATLRNPRYLLLQARRPQGHGAWTPKRLAMATPQSSSGADAGSNRPDDAEAQPSKRSRPLSALQEAAFFGVTFAVALALQLAVILKVSNIIAW